VVGIESPLACTLFKIASFDMSALTVCDDCGDTTLRLTNDYV